MRYRIRQPSPGMLVIKPWTEDDKTAGGIWIPATAVKEGSVTVGEVVAINPPPGDDPDNYFKVGDVVVIGKWSGTDIKLDPRGHKLIIVNEDSVLATLEPEPVDDSPCAG